MGSNSQTEVEFPKMGTNFKWSPSIPQKNLGYRSKSLRKIARTKFGASVIISLVYDQDNSLFLRIAGNYRRDCCLSSKRSSVFYLYGGYPHLKSIRCVTGIYVCVKCLPKGDQKSRKLSAISQLTLNAFIGLF